jgi:hypothetical protein
VARHRITIVLIVVPGVLVIAGCGSSKSSSTVAKRPDKSSPLSFMQENLKWAACIRKHGFPNLPDPTFGDGGAQVNLSTSINMTSPGFMLAERKCAALGLPGAGQAASESATSAQVAQAMAVSRCMRAHGVPNWPDPTKLVPSNAGVTGAVPNTDLVYVIPKSIELAAPAVMRAGKACGYQTYAPNG